MSAQSGQIDNMAKTDFWIVTFQTTLELEHNVIELLKEDYQFFEVHNQGLTKDERELFVPYVAESN